MENRMKEVAALLGVEIDEEFKSDGIRFKLTEGGLNTYNTNAGWIGSTRLEKFLTGEYEVEKLPFYPKEHGAYWSINLNGGVFYSPVQLDLLGDLNLIGMGNCFRTKEEAEANKDRIMQQFEEIRKKCKGVSQ